MYHKFIAQAKDLSVGQLETTMDQIQYRVSTGHFSHDIFVNGCVKLGGYVFIPKIETFMICFCYHLGPRNFQVRYAKDLETCIKHFQEDILTLDDLDFEVIPYPFKEI